MSADTATEREEHWQGVYATKRPEEVSWFAPHLSRSLDAIRAVASPQSAIIDIGGGASTLVDDLLELGFTNLAVLDISAKALETSRARLGADRAARVRWIVADVTAAPPAPHSIDLWHDRAVFHFLTSAADRSAYARAAAAAIRPGGHLIISVFSDIDGPTRCSGLDVLRHSGATLAAELGASFRLVDELTAIHTTPAGKEQRFVHCTFARIRSGAP